MTNGSKNLHLSVPKENGLGDTTKELVMQKERSMSYALRKLLVEMDQNWGWQIEF